MIKYLCFLTVLATLLSCSKKDDGQGEERTTQSTEAQIKFYQYSGTNEKDSLYYENNRLILHKAFVGDLLEYNHNYIYNDKNQLVEINKTHSTVSYPIQKSTYSYYDDGTLRSRNFINFVITITETYTYGAGIIYINAGSTEEIRIHLDDLGRIISAEKKAPSSTDFLPFLIYEYDLNNNVVKIMERFYPTDPFEEFNFIFDTKKNPFFVFDFQLPNGLTIKRLEAITTPSNYPLISAGDNENYALYLNNNNFVSATRNTFSSYTYSYTYDDNDNPIKIDYDFLNDGIDLTLKY